eukprot:GHVU01202566.1.p1 GENE.GHVU01202566.1~~GHVU01202566.1.p1  ORF type:complete len:158 (-),score=2.31 GHVU01202566.1:215-688(-)
MQHKMRRRLKAGYLQSSTVVEESMRTISDCVAELLFSSSFMIAWHGNSFSFITMFGKSTKRTSDGSNIPRRVTMICFGCSSTGRDRIKAANSSAVFHLDSCDRRFCPAHKCVWIIFKNSCPVQGRLYPEAYQGYIDPRAGFSLTRPPHAHVPLRSYT